MVDDQSNYMYIQEVVAEFKSQREAARELNIPRSTLYDLLQKNELVFVVRDDKSDKIIEVIRVKRGHRVHTPEPDQGPNTTFNDILTKTPRNTIVASPSEVRQNTYEEAVQAQAEALQKDLYATKKRNEDLAIKCQTLTSELNRAKKDRLITEEVRKYILKLTEKPITPAEWLTDYTPDVYTSSFVGVPTLLLSDIHLGEKVYSSQVFGKNEYNVAIGKKRLREVCNRTIDVLKNHMVAPKGYPGIIVDLAGDLVTGDIHEELVATNDQPTLPCVVDLVSELSTMFKKFADAFGRVMVFSVPGNHGRTTKKMQFKNLSYTNYDWLIGCLLEKFLMDDPRIQFYVSDQTDIQYKVYDHRYRLTHGFQFRGGQGFVGPYAPIARGDKKKRSSAVSYGMEYDTLVLGHFHQLWMPGQMIVNGSVIGFNEFAMSNNFEYDVPKQALWITNPVYGITYTMPIFCETPEKKGVIEDNWVQWQD